MTFVYSYIFLLHLRYLELILILRIFN